MRKLYASEEWRRQDAIDAAPLVEVEAQLVCLRLPLLHVVEDGAGKWGRGEGSAPINKGFVMGIEFFRSRFPERFYRPRFPESWVCFRRGEEMWEGRRNGQCNG
jgi:hypothetical protein